MACFTLVVLLSLICLLPRREYYPGRRDSPNSSNQTLRSEHTEEELPFVG